MFVVITFHESAEAHLVEHDVALGRQGHGRRHYRYPSRLVTDIGSGTKVIDAAPVRGMWRRLSSPDDVLTLMDTTAEGVVACVADAGATFLAPIFDELTAIVCLSGTPMSHIGIVSREYQVPCVMAAVLSEEPADGDMVEVDCSGAQGMVRRAGS